MNARQLGLFLKNENMHMERVSRHILLYQNDKCIRVFHSLSHVESYLKKEGYIPERYYDKQNYKKLLRK